ncbi:MAG: DUF4392 domain-containing protein [bacterium]|nr:MAG: DUF4392 domain-containing protein [bacterium]
MSNSHSKIAQIINQLEWFIQTDMSHRGIHHLPGENLCTYCQGNLYRAIKFLAENAGCQVGIVTGFYVPTANPPAPETDGPPGALFLARGLNQLGYPVLLITDRCCWNPLEQGIELFKHQITNYELVEFPFELKIPDKNIIVDSKWHYSKLLTRYVRSYLLPYPRLRCLISIERVGPCHTMHTVTSQIPLPNQRTINQFIKKGPGDLKGECLNMNAVPVTQYTAPIHILFKYKSYAKYPIFTIGIGDGGNEIGMGSIPWKVIAKNIINGQGNKMACSIQTDATIVAGVSNWAGYAFIAGLYLYLNRIDDFLNLYSESAETKLIETYYQTKTAVDGKLGYPAMSIDGIRWEVHLIIIDFILKLIRNGLDL